jgi:carbon storage regulator CsrA
MLLVVSRRAGDALVIGDVTVTVVDVGEDSARLEVDGPPELQIRPGEEVFELPMSEE